MNANMVTRYRQGGMEELEKAVRQIRISRHDGRGGGRRGAGEEQLMV